MPASLSELDIVAGHVARAQRAVATVHLLTMPGIPSEKAARAHEVAGIAAQEVGHALARLLELGAQRPDATAPAEPIPLLALDTPDTRELLALLERAQAVAERVDAARGLSLPADVPLPQGQSRGTDIAETISEIALRMRTEVHGPKGRE